MAHAYTPGLKVTEKFLVRKERRLPLKGEVLSKVGEQVNCDTVVAKTNLPGNVQILNVAGILGCPPQDLGEYLLKKPGDTIRKGETVAQSKGFFGFFKSKAPSPCDGTLESISNITGQAILREPPQPVQVDAYIDGSVVEVFEREGVVVETVATFIQGIFGVGGEIKGELFFVSDKPDEILTEKEIDEKCRDKVLIGGALVTAPAVKKAIEKGAKGIVVGGIEDGDLKAFLGYELGVAITGSETLGITLIITEGFGRMRMADKTFSLLKEHIGERASINGATQIRAGVMRPEIIIPLDSNPPHSPFMKGGKEGGLGLVVGSPIRVIREPFFGQLGKVTGLPSELQTIETESKVRVLEVELSDARRVLLPRANVEMIEG
ncbi:hypothetical protein IIA15_03910 [candidate division TA06 bacterium]|nr:hypothetical protein [candidate division TA06 bacterium]